MPLLSALKHGFSPNKNRAMIQFVSVVLKEIFKQGKKFPWKRPSKCPNCGRNKVWGHGFVSRLFDGFREPLLLKRWRCPDCGCIILMSPESHFPRFQSSKKDINHALEHRLTHGRWPPDLSPARMRYWLRNLKRQVRAHLPPGWKSRLMDAYEHLIDIGKIPASSAI